MKQKIYLLGIATTILLFAGTTFKSYHWPLAGFLIAIGIFILLFVFLPLALVSNYKSEGKSGNRILYIITWMTCFTVFTAMLFKIMHWPGAGIALVIALPFPYVVYLPVFLYITSKNKNFNIYSTAFIFFLLTVVSGLSALLAVNS